MAESISVEDAARACRVRAGTGQTESNESRDEVEDVSLSEMTARIQHPTINPCLLRLIALLTRAWALDVLQALGDGQKTDTPSLPALAR
jgi:hypothetical protein